MPDPVNVTITDSSVSPCNITLHQNTNNGANSVIFTNNGTSTAAWSVNGAAAVLADQAPPNSNNPALNNYNISPNGGTLQLWVKDNASLGNGVNKQYTISINGNTLACIDANPPDMQIDP